MDYGYLRRTDNLSHRIRWRICGMDMEGLFTGYGPGHGCGYGYLRRGAPVAPVHTGFDTSTAVHLRRWIRHWAPTWDGDSHLDYGLWIADCAAIAASIGVLKFYKRLRHEHAVLIRRENERKQTCLLGGESVPFVVSRRVAHQGYVESCRTQDLSASKQLAVKAKQRLWLFESSTARVFPNQRSAVRAYSLRYTYTYTHSYVGLKCSRYHTGDDESKWKEARGLDRHARRAGEGYSTVADRRPLGLGLR
ncbi:hypothetical protein B0H13DRAFT_192082 [Mycena leptocephala]|nr:hypothetical protein B0H13DRAFT_192082 [Mycena leptocephala]